jgi:hypothetical protein
LARLFASLCARDAAVARAARSEAKAEAALARALRAEKRAAEATEARDRAMTLAASAQAQSERQHRDAFFFRAANRALKRKMKRARAKLEIAEAAQQETLKTLECEREAFRDACRNAERERAREGLRSTEAPHQELRSTEAPNAIARGTDDSAITTDALDDLANAVDSDGAVDLDRAVGLDASELDALELDASELDASDFYPSEVDAPHAARAGISSHPRDDVEEPGFDDVEISARPVPVSVPRSRLREIDSPLKNKTPQQARRHLRRLGVLTERNG